MARLHRAPTSYPPIPPPAPTRGQGGRFGPRANPIWRYEVVCYATTRGRGAPTNRWYVTVEVPWDTPREGVFRAAQTIMRRQWRDYAVFARARQQHTRVEWDCYIVGHVIDLGEPPF